MHRSLPRFGHSSNVALIASNNQEKRQDYIRGVLAFSIFLFTLIALWCGLLVIFKFIGKNRVGCAAGGETVVISYLRREKRRKLRRIVRRSWRVQTAFFLSSITLAVASGLFLRYGVFRFTEALYEIQDINDDIDSVAFRAMGITELLWRAQKELGLPGMQALFDGENFCPNVEFDTKALLDDVGFSGTSETVLEALDGLAKFLDRYVGSAKIATQEVAEATERVKNSINMWHKNDWLLKLFVLLLNVINVFLFGGLCLSRHNLVHEPYRRLLSIFLVPSFTILLVAASVSTCIFSVAAVFNADFCAGGDSPGSPEGTMEAILLGRNVTKNELTYRMFVYYMSDCTTKNPIGFVAPYRDQLQGAIERLIEFTKVIPNYDIILVSDECDSDLTPIVASITNLTETLETMRGGITGVMELTSCTTVSPILRRIIFGPICTESIKGLTWMFSTTLVITVMGLVMLSLRAALYNATERKKRKPSRRAAQREWNEYKQYMSEYYEDAEEWTKGPLSENESKESGFALQTGSFDTEVTAKPSDVSNDSDEDGDEEEDEGDGLYVMPSLRANSSVAQTSDEIYETPRQARRFRLRFDDVEFAYRTRNMQDVLDSELVPLSPIPEQIRPPGAPRKPNTSLQRTSQGKLC